jgi:hypothetical protein
MRKAMVVVAILAIAAGGFVRAGTPQKTEEDLQREAALEEFTKKMKANNYPALFEKAAQEFNVPADILKGVAFAETRWEQFKWPPGETRSPENGMPRPFGIMSLWDNEFFGHTLMEAAALIGKTPEELKEDAYQNMRGGAALLRKIYDETPKPGGTTDADIESWRYAIRKYCGIPEPDLNALHALDVYLFMNKGYHQYGLEWDAHPVNLEPMREDTKRIVAEEKAKKEALQAGNSNSIAKPPPQVVGSEKNDVEPMRETALKPVAVAQAAPVVAQPASPTRWNVWWLMAIGGVLAVLAAILALRRKPAHR